MVGTINAPDTPDRLKSTWSMEAYEFERLTNILSALDVAAVQVRMRKNEYIEPYSALLFQLWLNLQPLLRSRSVKHEMENRLENARGVMEKWIVIRKKKNFPVELARTLEDIHKDLLWYRQQAGLGVKAFRDKSDMAKIKEDLAG